MALTPKQQAFVDYLLTDPEQNASKAALHAYPKLSEKAAAAAGSRLLTNVKVREYLAEQRAKRSERTKIDADWLLRRLADEADADVADLYDEATGALRPVKEWPLIFRQGLVAGIDVNQIEVDGSKVGEVVKIKLADRNAKLKMIGEHIGVQAFKHNVNHTGNVVIFNNDYGDEEN